MIHTLGEPLDNPDSGRASERVLGDALDEEGLRTGALWDGETPSLDWAVKTADAPSLQRGGRLWDDSFHQHDSDFSALNISWNGRFCRIAARDGSIRCLVKMAEMIEKLHMWLPEVDDIIVFVHKPLLRYLRKLRPREVPRSADPATYTSAGAATATATATGATAAAAEIPSSEEKWEWDYPGYHGRASSEAEYAAVLEPLLRVDSLEGRRHRPRRLCGLRSGGEEDPSGHSGLLPAQEASFGAGEELEAELAAQLPPMDLMSSSVAYSVAEDSSIVTADRSFDNIENMSVVHPESGSAAAGAGGESGYVVRGEDVVTSNEAQAAGGGPGPGDDATAGAADDVDAAAASVEQSSLVEPDGAVVSVEGIDTSNAGETGAEAETGDDIVAPAEGEGGAPSGASVDADGAGAAAENAESNGAEQKEGEATPDGGGDGTSVEAPPGDGTVDASGTASADYGDGVVSSSAPATAAAGDAPVEGDAFPPPPGSPVPKPSTAPAGMTLSAVGSVGMGLMSALSRSRDDAEGNKAPQTIQEDEHGGSEGKEENEESSVFQQMHDEDMARSVLLEPEPEPEPEPLPEEQIRHIILPLYTVPGQQGPSSAEEDHWATSREQIKFARGLQLLHGDVEYEFERDPELGDYNLGGAAAKGAPVRQEHRSTQGSGRSQRHLRAGCVSV